MNGPTLCRPLGLEPTLCPGTLRGGCGVVMTTPNFAHNHPSGVAEPSRADEVHTATLKRALALVDINVLDHFIVGSTTKLSFRSSS